MDWDHYITRQATHDRELGFAHKYRVLEKANPGFDLNMVEESWIRRLGGPKRKGGTLANKRYQVNDADYCANGGTVPKPTP
jgi:hypothetical protein